MKAFITTSADPAWLSAISTRRAALWIGSSLQKISAEERDSLLRLAAHPWLAIYVEPSRGFPDLVDSVDVKLMEPYTLRNVSDDPDDVSLAPNRVPVFHLPAQGSGSPLSTLHRFKMLQQIPPGAVVFAISKDPDADSTGLAEVVQRSTGITTGGYLERNTYCRPSMQAAGSLGCRHPDLSTLCPKSCGPP